MPLKRQDSQNPTEQVEPIAMKLGGREEHTFGQNEFDSFSKFVEWYHN